MPGAAASTGNSLLRVAHACETLLAGFNSGKAAAVRSCLVSRQHAESLVAQQAAERTGGAATGPAGATTTAAVSGEHNNAQKQQQRGAIDALLPVRGAHLVSFRSNL